MQDVRYPITTKPTTTLQVGTSLTHTRGSHTMKMGASYDYGYNRSVRNQARTTLTANGRSSNDVDALVGLLLARFENAARSFGQTERKMGQQSIGIFFNDDWRATPRLTLSAGLRYEVVGPVTEENDLLERSSHSISPRLPSCRRGEIEQSRAGRFTHPDRASLFRQALRQVVLTLRFASP